MGMQRYAEKTEHPNFSGFSSLIYTLSKLNKNANLYVKNEAKSARKFGNVTEK